MQRHKARAANNIFLNIIFIYIVVKVAFLSEERKVKSEKSKCLVAFFRKHYVS